jgi:hypothetical protein
MVRLQKKLYIYIYIYIYGFDLITSINEHRVLVVGRAKMWSHQMLPEMFSAAFSSDSFFLNLGVLLLRLSLPFTATNPRLVHQVQPTYCLATVGDRTVARARKVHMIGN